MGKHHVQASIHIKPCRLFNVITPEGGRLDIFADRPTECSSAKKNERCRNYFQYRRIDSGQKSFWINGNNLREGEVVHWECFVKVLGTVVAAGFDEYLEKYEDAVDLYTSGMDRQIVSAVNARGAHIE